MVRDVRTTWFLRSGLSVAGAVRVAEAALQLMGKAGKHQVEGAGKALAQGHCGPCGQAQCVIVLEKGV